MSKRVEVDTQVEVNIEGLSDDQIVEVIADSLTSIADQLESAGVDPELITAVFFRQFAERMCESGDRAGYEEVLEIALEDEWEEITLH